MAEPARKLPPEDTPDIRPHLSSVPGAGQGDGVPQGRLRAVDSDGLSQDELSEAEASPARHLRSVPDLDASEGEQTMTADDQADSSTSDRSFFNRDGDKKKSNKREIKFKNAMGSSSGLKKKLAIAGAAGGGSIIVGIIAFLALLPLKIEHMVDNLETRFAASSEGAIDNETENLFSQYVAQQILPSIIKDRCHSTIDGTCASIAEGTGPVVTLFNTWRQSKLEQKLATNYGILIGKKGNQLYMNVGGVSLDDSQMKDVVAGRASLFDLKGTTAVTRNQLRTTLRDSLKGATLYDKAYFRFKIGPYVEKKFGMPRCVLACDQRDSFSDKVADKKLAAKAKFVQWVVGPLSESYGLAIECVMSGGPQCSTKPDSSDSSTSPDDAEALSPYNKGLSARLAAYEAANGSEKLTDLLAKADGISKDGLTKYVFRSVLSDALGKEVDSEAIDKVAGPAAWVNFAAKVVTFVNNAGPTIKKFNYAASAAASVHVYMMYRTSADELKSGHTDSTEMGSLSDQLDNGGVDATSTPLYNYLLGNSGPSISQPAFSDLLPGASADTTGSSNYTCQDGKPVPAGQTVCSEEAFNGGSNAANALTSAAKSIPGWNVISAVASAEQSTVGKLLGWVSKLIANVSQYIPGVSGATKALSDFIEPFITAFAKDIFPNILADGTNIASSASSSQTNDDPVLPGGGRTFDLMAGGADTVYNKSCQVELGCAEITNVQASAMQNQQLQDQKTDFDHESMFARMFDTSSSYSLVSRLAMDLPTNLGETLNSGFASLLSNPFGKLVGSFSAIFSTDHAFAGGDTLKNDPFGVVQNGYTDAQIPADPTGYWQQNCQGDYTTAWVDGQTEDPSTGDAIATKPNPCLLINASAESAGGVANNSMLPAGSQNNDN